MNTKPWTMNPDLTEDSIKIIANLICTVRSEVVDRHDEELGDTCLSLGTRAYECSRKRIIRLSNDNIHPWLSIIKEKGRFTFKIGDTPVRFTRNNPKYLPANKLIVAEEAQQLVFADFLPGYGQSEPIIWFFVIDTPALVPAEAMYMVGYTPNNEIQCQWEIPLEDFIPVGLSLVTNNLPEAVELPPALVSIKRKSQIIKGNDE